MINIRHLVITALYKSVIEADFKTVERKFLEQGIEKSLIKNVLEDFKELKNKLIHGLLFCKRTTSRFRLLTQPLQLS